MKNQEKPPINPEVSEFQLEAFVPLETIQWLILETFARGGRIDENGVVQQVEVTRIYSDKKFFRSVGESIFVRGPLLPSMSEWNFHKERRGEKTIYYRTCWNLHSRIYDSLTGMYDLKLTEQQRQGLTEADELLDAASRRQNYTMWLNDDYMDHLRIHDLNGNQHGREFEQFRFYIHAGLSAMSTMTKIIEAGARFADAKIWIPHNTTSQQRFRNDTPIIIVDNFDQLWSTARAIKTASSESLEGDSSPLLGCHIPNLPGVYIAQTSRGKSFNGTMADLFAPAIAKAFSGFEQPQTGETVSYLWLNDLAQRARQIAYADAENKGVSQMDHAFLVGQPRDKILETIRAAVDS